MDRDDLKPASDFGVSKALSDVIAAGLALKPEDRPQTAQAFLTQLVRTGAGEAATNRRVHGADQ